MENTVNVNYNVVRAWLSFHWDRIERVNFLKWHKLELLGLITQHAAQKFFLYRQPWLPVLSFKHKRGCEWIYTIKFQIKVPSYLLVLPYHASWLNFFFSWFSYKQTIYSKVYTLEKLKKENRVRKKDETTRCIQTLPKARISESANVSARDDVICLCLRSYHGYFEPKAWVTHYAWESACIIRNGWNKCVSVSRVMLYVNHLTIFIRISFLHFFFVLRSLVFWFNPKERLMNCMRSDMIWNEQYTRERYH